MHMHTVHLHEYALCTCTHMRTVHVHTTNTHSELVELEEQKIFYAVINQTQSAFINEENWQKANYSFVYI